MTWSGRVGSGSGWVGLARIIVCNFWVGSGFFSFGSNISAHTRPVIWSDRIGFFRAGWVGFIGSDGHDQVYFDPQHSYIRIQKKLLYFKLLVACIRQKRWKLK